MPPSPFALNLRDAASYVSAGELVTVLAAAEQTAAPSG